MCSFLCYRRKSAGFKAAEECYEPPPPAVRPFEHLLATATASGRYKKRLSWTDERTGLGGSTTQPVRKEKYVVFAMDRSVKGFADHSHLLFLLIT